MTRDPLCVEGFGPTSVDDLVDLVWVREVRLLVCACSSATGAQRAVGSPFEWLAVVEEAAGGAVVGEGGQPDGGVGALVGAAWRVGAAEVGADPAGGGGVHEDAGAGEFGGQDPGQGVEGRFGDAVGGLGGPGHVVQ